MLDFYNSILRKIKHAETVLAVLMFGFIVLIIAAQIFVRYIFGKPFPWAEELASLLLIYLTFLTADIVYKEKGHISIDYFIKFLPSRVRSATAVGVYLLISFFLISMIPPCIALLKLQSGHISTAVVTVPKSFWSLPVIVAFGSMLLTTGYFILEEIVSFLKP
jgi:TRAP-type C4-dicarboxylate transport system permease small subunit